MASLGIPANQKLSTILTSSTTKKSSFIREQFGCVTKSNVKQSSSLQQICRSYLFLIYARRTLLHVTSMNLGLTISAIVLPGSWTCAQMAHANQTLRMHTKIINMKYIWESWVFNTPLPEFKLTCCSVERYSVCISHGKGKTSC